MRPSIRSLFLLILGIPSLLLAVVNVGIGKADITPPIGTPSAGYTERKGDGMAGTHDPLLAIALFIDNGEKKIVFCSVDHLGYTHEMIQEIVSEVQSQPGLEQCEIYIASSHTHSGGGAFLNIPFIGSALAGPYSPEITQYYVEKTSEAILQSTIDPIPAKIGIGYGNAEELSRYRGQWPIGISPLSDVSIIKITKDDDSPYAVLFNYPVHPTVLTAQNRLFSSDFVGCARDSLQASLGVEALYFNGAQGDIIPAISSEGDRFSSCAELGESLAATVEQIWNETDVSPELQIATQKESYAFKPQPNPFGFSLPIELYRSEMNVIVLNREHAFITIPGELSCLYDARLKKIGAELGFAHVSIFGLTNDAHGYIILPESWKRKTFESSLSFGGEYYGERIKNCAVELLRAQAQ